MARLIKTSVTWDVYAKVTTAFEDGTKSTKTYKKEDLVTDLRYVESEAVHKATGRISDIVTACTKVTRFDVKNPVDYFSDDVKIKSVVVDASSEYHSNVLSIPGMEIVEDEGVFHVDHMEVVAYPVALMDMEYTDGTIAHQDLEVGDTLKNVKMMSGTPGTPDIAGDFVIASFIYNLIGGKLTITGIYLQPLDGGNAISAPFNQLISFDEVPHGEVTATDSLGEIATLLNESPTGEASAVFGADVVIPDREDGVITTLMVNEGQTLNVDLNGHTLTTRAYAFYVNGGTLNISDSGDGAIVTTMKNNAYPAVFVAKGGTCNMDSGLIDTTQVVLDSETDYNWMYGVVCSGDGVFNMTGGKILTKSASGISITNGTASGTGAKFNIGGDAVLECDGCAAIYLADNKSITISDNAEIRGGMVLRMGDITVKDNAKVMSVPADKETAPLGSQVMLSGVDTPDAAILALTGIYGSALGNDLNIKIEGNAEVTSFHRHAIEVATINTKFDQKVTVDIADGSKLKSASDDLPIYKVFDHEELAALVAEIGKTLAPETKSTDLTITIDGNIVYPVVDGE